MTMFFQHDDSAAVRLLRGSPSSTSGIDDEAASARMPSHFIDRSGTRPAPRPERAINSALMPAVTDGMPGAKCLPYST